MCNPMSASEAIRNRRSIRKYRAGENVSDEQIKRMLEAAMMAPSACNTRPWSFYVIQTRKTLDALAKIHPYAKMLKNAPLCIAVCALPDTQKDLAKGFFPQDCAAATENILLESTALGLGSCWCGLYPNDKLMGKVKTVLQIEDQSTVPFCLIAIGTSDEAPSARGFYEQDKVFYR